MFITDIKVNNINKNVTNSFHTTFDDISDDVPDSLNYSIIYGYIGINRDFSGGILLKPPDSHAAGGR